MGNACTHMHATLRPIIFCFHQDGTPRVTCMWVQIACTTLAVMLPRIRVARACVGRGMEFNEMLSGRSRSHGGWCGGGEKERPLALTRWCGWQKAKDLDKQLALFQKKAAVPPAAAGASGAAGAAGADAAAAKKASSGGWFSKKNA